MRYKSAIYFFVFLIGIHFAFAEKNIPIKDTTNVIKPIIIYDSTKKSQDTIDESPIISILDSLVNYQYFKKLEFASDTALLNVHRFPVNYIPKYSDSVYFERISDLNVNSPISLEYNQYVKAYINLYTVKRRNLTSKILGLSRLYFPMIEEQLDKYDIPLELKYLAIVESALNPKARSRAGAAGLWQFMYGTAKMYKLNITSFVDERYDPYKSTIAACEHLKDLYGIYHNWLLVLAAYNSGAGNVNKAIRRSGGKRNFWQIQYYLPRETRAYVAAFIAVNYVMNYHAEHNIYPLIPRYTAFQVDTVAVKQILSFAQISEKLNIPIDVLKPLNPAYKKGIIPSTKNKIYYLRLPEKYIASYIDNETALYDYETRKGIKREKLLSEIKRYKQRQIHRVRNGENLGYIALRYHCSVRGLKAWNHLRRNTIYPGQKLVIYPSHNYYYKKKPTRNYSTISRSKYRDSKYIYYVVQEGDTLWSIANEYKGVTVKQIKRLNNIKNVRRLKPGRKIIIAVAS